MTGIVTVDVALAQADTWLETMPARASLQAQEILRQFPTHPRALTVFAAAQRRLGQTEKAHEILRDLARSQPHAAIVHYEYGLCLAIRGQQVPALAAIRHALALKPREVTFWRGLGDVLTWFGDAKNADAAYANATIHALDDPHLITISNLIAQGDLAGAETMLRAHLRIAPTDVAGILLFADVAQLSGHGREAQTLLARALQLAPSFHTARARLAQLLFAQNRAADCLDHLRILLDRTPHDPVLRNLLAACLAMVGDSDGAVAIYRDIIGHFADNARIWLSYGHALRAAGRHDETQAAYRQAIRLEPHLGEAYWSLANLKTSALTLDDIAAMRQFLTRDDIDDDDRLHFHYALGQALESQAHYAQSFTHYQQGARIRRSRITYNADETSALVTRLGCLFTADFMAARQEAGCPDTAPIFIVGLPRSGSTLIEQILASHALVEGTMELPELPRLARPLMSDPKLTRLMPAQWAKIGQDYIARSRAYRRTKKPFFIDKLPNNWLYIGFIRLILPQAKIIDARRHRMAAGFSAFKQHFARGQHFSYDLHELGRYYDDYERLTAHFDRVAPGLVHRVHYEDMIMHTDQEIRRLLKYCGLEFDAACLTFWQTPRSVRTASSEQVRQPIFRQGLDQWRHYEQWLAPLRPGAAPTSPAPTQAGQNTDIE